MIRSSLLHGLVGLLALPALAQNVITTVAGSGRTFRGDGLPAATVALGVIQGVATDLRGNVYASDGSRNIVVKISPEGTLTVVAGNGIAGHSGDGGPATGASLKNPAGLAVNAAGDLYIADERNGRIRKVTADGAITTVAGGGSSTFRDGGPATAGRLSARGVAVDAAGNIYIADTYSHRIRKVTAAGTISTIAGNGTQGFSGDGGPVVNAVLDTPNGIAVDSSGTLFIADQSNSRIRRIANNGIISTVAGNGTGTYTGDGGQAVVAGVGNPRSVALDNSGNLNIAQGYPYPVRKVTPAGVISTVAGGRAGFSGDGGPAMAAALNELQGVAVDAVGNLYIADSINGRVRKVSAGVSGTITTLAGTGLANFAGDGGPAVSAALSEPLGVAVDSTGNLFIADHLNHRIRKVVANGTISTVAGNGTEGVSGDGGAAINASLGDPTAVALSGAGELYIADSAGGKIRKVTPVGIISTVAGGGPDFLAGPRGVTLDAAGNLYIADTFNHRIRRVNMAGITTTVAGTTQGFSGDGGPATAASLNSPYGVAVDADGNLYIADSTNRRVCRVAPNGTITTVAGGGSNFTGNGIPATSAALSYPIAVATDATSNFYIGDSGIQRVRRVGRDGIINDVTGTGDASFSGDGGPASSATLNQPSGLALDAAGNLYIGDARNDRVRKILAVAPAVSVSPASLSFTATAGSPEGTAQQLSVTSAVSGLSFSAQAATAAGGNWLSVSPATGSTPGAIAASVDATNLDPGTYRGTVTVQAPLAVPPGQTVAIEVTVGAAVPSQLVAEPPSLTFAAPTGVCPAGPDRPHPQCRGGHAPVDRARRDPERWQLAQRRAGFRVRICWDAGSGAGLRQSCRPDARHLLRHGRRSG